MRWVARYICVILRVCCFDRNCVCVDRTGLNVTACQSPISGNCCSPRRAPTGSWTISPSKSRLAAVSCGGETCYLVISCDLFFSNCQGIQKRLPGAAQETFWWVLILLMVCSKKYRNLYSKSSILYFYMYCTVKLESFLTITKIAYITGVQSSKN